MNLIVLLYYEFDINVLEIWCEGFFYVGKGNFNVEKWMFIFSKIKNSIKKFYLNVFFY